MTNVYDNIELMRSRIIIGKPNNIARLIGIYSSGVCSKIKNAEYAFLMISMVAPDDPSSTSTSPFTASDRINFYTDSFFAFLFSVFDVMAQVVNQKQSLLTNERDVTFNSIKNQLYQILPGTPIQTKFHSIKNARFFKQLEKYRHCSTHRRHIYIKTITTETTESPGYSSTTPITDVIRLLCDDALTLNPTVNQKREIITYCRKMLDRVKKEIAQIAIIL